tara:strand:+ start:670 stop:852 length:183 start_codon:yes stop_codon:yes gene_type:complete
VFVEQVEWSEFELDRVQLYHVPTDPYEDNNVALENPELVESLAAKVRMTDRYRSSIEVEN